MTKRRRTNPSTAEHEAYARKYLAEADDLLAIARENFEQGNRVQGWRTMLDAYESVAEGNAELVHLLEDDAYAIVAKTAHLLDDLSNLQDSMRETILQGLGADLESAQAMGPRVGKLTVIPGGRTGNPHRTPRAAR